jgi:hypothetical protein
VVVLVVFLVLALQEPQILVVVEAVATIHRMLVALVVQVLLFFLFQQQIILELKLDHQQ